MQNALQHSILLSDRKPMWKLSSSVQPTPLKKLSDKYLWPYEILAKVGTHTYILWLPDTFRGVHPIYHVSMLKPETLNKISNRVQLPPQAPVEVQGELEYEIAEIADSKIDHCRSCKLLYLVCWLGYKNTEEFSWLPTRELEPRKRLTLKLSLRLSRQTRSNKYL